MSSIKELNFAPLVEILGNNEEEVTLWENSVHESGTNTFFLIRHKSENKLIINAAHEKDLPETFNGEVVKNGDYNYKICALTPHNAEQIRTEFPHTKPRLLGKDHDSFGFGDRLGIAGPAHVRSVVTSGFKPVFAQQSIRELERTNRSPQQVIDAATWAVFQEGYKDGFGADADHLKTKEHIDRTIFSGFTMFTIDPSDHVNDEAHTLSKEELTQQANQLPWKDLKDDLDSMMNRYVDRKFDLPYNTIIEPTESEILQGIVKYGNVISHIQELYRYLKSEYPDKPSEVELSVDETEHTTTPVEHLLIASELQRLGVDLVSLAPRFSGDFEKGIDFKGDIELFKQDYLKHQAIATEYGGYKLSVHSGSDKFSVYEQIGKLGVGQAHVKTAGTSYLEALRSLAMEDPKLFREIAGFSADRFEEDRKTYHISASIQNWPELEQLADAELPGLLDDDNARQILHVTFGSVISEIDANNKPKFKDRILEALKKHEQTHFKCLEDHFEKHLKPFRSTT